MRWLCHMITRLSVGSLAEGQGNLGLFQVFALAKKHVMGVEVQFF